MEQDHLISPQGRLDINQFACYTKPTGGHTQNAITHRLFDNNCFLDLLFPTGYVDRRYLFPVPSYICGYPVRDAKDFLHLSVMNLEKILIKKKRLRRLEMEIEDDIETIRRYFQEAYDEARSQIAQAKMMGVPTQYWQGKKDMVYLLAEKIGLEIITSDPFQMNLGV